MEGEKTPLLGVGRRRNVLDARVRQIGHLGKSDGLLVDEVLTPQEHFDEHVEFGGRLDVLELEYGRVDLGGELLPLHRVQEVGERRLVRLLERQQCHRALELFLNALVRLAVLAQVVLRKLQRRLQFALTNQLD